MMTEGTTFDPVWRDIYAGGRQQRYPWDAVVSFVFRNAPRDRDRGDVRILEVGCGTASNLWFAAREGFDVTGVDASETAIEVARRRFADEGLCGQFHVADFTELPVEGDRFDLAIDRAAISCCGLAAGRRAIGEVQRALRQGGRFFFNPYAAGHGSQTAGRPGPDGVVVDIEGGTLTGVGQICFYSEDDVKRAFAQGWSLLSQQHLAVTEQINDSLGVHREWRVVAEKAA